MSRYYSKQYSNQYNQGRYNNNYGNRNYKNNNYYNNGDNYGNHHSNTNYNNNYNYGKDKGYYRPKTTQFKEVEVKNKDEKERYDKNEIPNYVKQINENIDADKLKDFCLADKETIKLAENECPINTNLMLYDISIAIKGPEEELAYLRHPNYISIIRRGNTLLEVYREGRGREEYIYQYSLLIRKGMKKFIDLPFNFYREKTEKELKEEEEEKKSNGDEENEKKIDKFTLNFDLDEEKKSTLKYIFYPVLQELENDFYIEIIKLMKANGENAQISYIKKFDYWVIASKNVCLLLVTKIQKKESLQDILLLIK